MAVSGGARVLKVILTGDAGPLSSAFGQAEGTVSGKSNKMIATIAKIGVAAAAAAAAAAVAFGVKGVRSFLDFDDAMTKSLAIMSDVDSGMRDKLEKAARDVGKTTKFSAAEAADAYFFLASAGMTAAQQIDALPAVARFAQAGMFDLSTATDLATDAQSALGLAADDPAENLKNLTRVTDVFVRANELANTSVQQISEAMTNKAGAAMRSTGMDIEEGSAVLAAFADQGVKGAEAGTQFSIVMRDLQTRAIKNKEAFEEAGIAVYDADGNLRNMADIVGDLEGHLEGMTDEQKKAAFATLGFTDKSSASLTTLLGTSDAIREYEAELRAAGGTTERVAGKQMESFRAKMGLMKAQVDDVALSVGEFLVTGLFSLGEKLAPQAAAAASFATGFVDSFKSWAGSDGPTGVIDGLRSAAVALMPHFRAFGAAVLPIITDLAAKFRDVAGPALRQFGELISTQLLPAVGKILPVITPIIAWLLGVLGGALIGAFKGIVQVISGVITTISGILNFFAALFTGDWSALWAATKQIFSGAWEIIKGLVKVFLNIGILKLFKVGFNLIRSLVTGAWSAIRGTWTSAINGVKNTTVRVWNAIRNAFTSALNGIRNGIRKVLTGIGSVIRSAWKSYRSAFNSGLSNIRSLVTNVLSAIRNSWTKALSGLRTAATRAWSAIRNAFTSALNGVKRIVSSVLGWMRGYFRSMWSAYRSVFTTGLNAIRSAVSRVLNGVRSVVRGAMSAIRGAFSSAWNAVRSGTTSAFNGIRSAIQGAISRVISLIRGIRGKIAGVFRGAGSWLRNAGRDILQGLLGGINAGIDKVKSTLNRVTGMIPSWKGPPKRDAELLKPAGSLIMGGLNKSLAKGGEETKRQLMRTTRDIGNTKVSPARIGLSGAGGRSAGGGTNVYVTVQGSVIAERDFVKTVTPAIRTEIERANRRAR